MRRGCIAIGEVKCDGCQRFIEHGQQYLLVEEEQGKELRLCSDCCSVRGYASYKTEKGKRVLTFFGKAGI